MPPLRSSPRNTPCPEALTHCWRPARAGVGSWHHGPPPRMLQRRSCPTPHDQCSGATGPHRCQPEPGVGVPAPLLCSRHPSLPSLFLKPTLQRRRDGVGGTSQGGEPQPGQPTLRAKPCRPLGQGRLHWQKPAPAVTQAHIWDSHRRRKRPTPQPPRRLQNGAGQEEHLPAGGPKPLPRPLHSIYNHHRFLKIPNIKK